MSFRPFQPFRAFGGAGAFLDPDAAAYIAAIESAGATVSAGQRSAIGAFVAGEKSGGRWESIKRLYLPIWGAAAPNAICMRSLASGTFVGGVTHGAGYWQADGATGYFILPGNPAGDGLTASNGSMMAGRLDAVSGAAEGVLGNTSPGRILLLPQGSGKMRSDWGDTRAIYTSAAQLDAGNGIFTSNRNGTEIRHNFRTASGVVSESAVVAISGAVPSGPIWASRIAGFYDQAKYICFGTSLQFSDADDKAYTLALKTLWETCTGLALP